MGGGFSRKGIGGVGSIFFPFDVLFVFHDISNIFGYNFFRGLVCVGIFVKK